MRTKPNKHILFVCALLALGMLGWLLVGSNRDEPRPKVFEIEGSPEARVAKATHILKKYCRPPGRLLDAHLAEDLFDNSGGLVPGPSDSHIYGVLAVAPSDLPRWRELLAIGPEYNRASELRPARPPKWWPSDQHLASAEVFHAQPLIGRAGGWAAISSANSSITFYAFSP